MLQSKPTDFVERNNLKALMAISRDWLLIFLIMTISMQLNNIFVYLIAVWLIGIFQYTLGDVILHEAVHYNLFSKRYWHEKLELIYAFPMFRTLSSYQKHHFSHHKYLLNAGDYVTEVYEDLGLNKPRKNIFIILVLKPILGLSVYAFFYSLCHDLLFQYNSWTDKFKNNFKLGLFWLVVILGFLVSGHFDVLVFYWFVPLVWSYSCYSIWCEVEQHFNTVSGTRTNINTVFNFLFHNSGYHYIHHLCPTIPWYKLPEAHNALCAENPDISKGIWDTYSQLVEEKKISDSFGNWDTLRSASFNN